MSADEPAVRLAIERRQMRMDDKIAADFLNAELSHVLQQEEIESRPGVQYRGLSEDGFEDVPDHNQRIDLHFLDKFLLRFFEVICNPIQK
jgi:hypothetical protein